MTSPRKPVPRGADRVTDATTSQTLDRGLRLLDVIAEAPAPPTVNDLADALGVHRSVAYRLLRTLERRDLILRDREGRFRMGPHVATLARTVAVDLRVAAEPRLRELADDLAMTAFLAVLDGADCVTILTAEPRTAIASIALRPGTRHPVTRGAPGIALQTLLTSAERVARGLPRTEPEAVAAARAAGHAISEGEVLAGVTAVAAPLRGAVPAAISVLFLDGDTEAPAARVRDAAAAISRAAA